MGGTTERAGLRQAIAGTQWISVRVTEAHVPKCTGMGPGERPPPTCTHACASGIPCVCVCSLCGWAVAGLPRAASFSKVD